MGQLEVAQASVRALLRPTREGQRLTRLVLKGMFGIATQAIPFGMFTERHVDRGASRCGTAFCLVR